MSSSDMMSNSSPSTLTSLPAYEVNRTRSPSLTWNAARLPFSSSLPSPTLMTLPWRGFSLAVSGSTMPPAVFSSASRRLTTILSFRGTTFMSSGLLVELTGVTLLLQGRRFILRPLAVHAHQGADDHVQHHVLADRLGDDAVGAGLERLAHQRLGGIAGDENTRQHGVDLVHQLQRLQSGHPGHVHVQQGQVHWFLADDIDRLFARRRQVGAKAFRLDD